MSTTTTKQHAPLTPRVHATWCVWTVEEDHDPVDECIGAERRVELSRERKLRMTDSSWRRPYMQANIATDDGDVTIHLGYDEELGHYFTPDEAQQYAVEILLLVAQAKGQMSGRGQDEPTHRPEPDVPGYCTCGTLTKLCEAQR